MTAMLDTVPLDRAWIAARIPHSGAMCLLDAVIAWNSESIRCRVTSHRDARNPLRANHRLATLCGIEYAAQAMAVHGAVLGASSELSNGTPARPRVGFLTSVRDVEAHVDRLDTFEGTLIVEAERMSGGANNLMYRFALHGDERILLSGRATVMLDASGATSLTQLAESKQPIADAACTAQRDQDHTP